MLTNTDLEHKGITLISCQPTRINKQSLLLKNYIQRHKINDAEIKRTKVVYFVEGKLFYKDQPRKL